MSTKKILEKTDHRPWALPTNAWQFYQEWNDVIFLHYEVALEDLLTFVPKDLNIDLYEGRAWISLVAFTMEKVRPKYLHPFPPISNFYELNVRTYVSSNNKAGVYFLSIEVGNKLSSALANVLSGLPYRYSNIERKKNSFDSSNNFYKDQFQCSYSVGNSIDSKTTLDLWLTERYALFHDIEQSIFEFEIHHLPWELHDVKMDQFELKYLRFEPLLHGLPTKTHYSKGLQVLTWGKRKLMI